MNLASAEGPLRGENGEIIIPNRAADLRDGLAKKLTAAQIADGQRLSREFKIRNASEQGAREGTAEIGDPSSTESGFFTTGWVLGHE